MSSWTKVGRDMFGGFKSGGTASQSTNVVVAGILAVALVVFSPFLLVIGMRPDVAVSCIIAFGIFWCALLLRDIEAHLREERERHALMLEDDSR